MRIPLLLGAIAACFAAAPAAADVTARYASSFGRGPAMTIQVNDRGDSRISTGNQMAVVTIGGESYLLEADLSGIYAVRVEDAMAAMREMFSAMSGEAGFPTPPPPSPDEALEPVEQGRETVAGRVGTVWSLRPHGATAAPGPNGFDFVISSDPDLAPVGRAFARQYGGMSEGMAAMLGPGRGGPGSLFAASRAILERGTMIRMGRMFRLDAVETGPVPASAFALPAAPLTRAQYAERKGWGAPPPAD